VYGRSTACLKSKVELGYAICAGKNTALAHKSSRFMLTVKVKLAAVFATVAVRLNANDFPAKV
jgi:hypothetical protein